MVIHMMGLTLHLNFWLIDPLGKVPNYLKVKSYDVNVSKSDTIKTKASVVFLIDDKEIQCHGEGNGP